MTMDREKEREIELESAMYTNCLLLGLDPAIIGIGANSGTPRVGLFRHSNPKLGEQLLYFILSSLRGPIQSAKVRFLNFHSKHFLSIRFFLSFFFFLLYYFILLFIFPFPLTRRDLSGLRQGLADFRFGAIA